MSTVLMWSQRWAAMIGSGSQMSVAPASTVTWKVVAEVALSWLGSSRVWEISLRTRVLPHADVHGQVQLVASDGSGRAGGEGDPDGVAVTLDPWLGSVADDGSQDERRLGAKGGQPAPSPPPVIRWFQPGFHARPGPHPPTVPRRTSGWVRDRLGGCHDANSRPVRAACSSA